MPEIDGVQVLKMFKSKKPQTPVIMTTGEASLEVTKKCLAEGAFTHMVKPIDFYNLAEVIGRALGLEDDWTTEADGDNEDFPKTEEEDDLTNERLDISEEDQKILALVNILEK
jgi:DNA-binding NtrC family response regulator